MYDDIEEVMSRVDEQAAEAVSAACFGRCACADCGPVSRAVVLEHYTDTIGGE